MQGLNFRGRIHQEMWDGLPENAGRQAFSSARLASFDAMCPNHAGDKAMLFLTFIASGRKTCLWADSASALCVPPSALWQRGESPIESGTSR